MEQRTRRSLTAQSLSQSTSACSGDEGAKLSKSTSAPAARESISPWSRGGSMGWQPRLQTR